MEKQIIGDLLKSAREARSLSIEDVSLKTKINLNILRSLESNKLDQLPNKTYVRGFVKTYGKLVGIPSDVIIESLDYTFKNDIEDKVIPQTIISSDEESNEKQKQVESEDLQDNLKSIASSMINKKVLVGIGIICVLFVVIKSLGAFLSQITSEQVKIVKEEKVTIPADTSEQIEVLDSIENSTNNKKENSSDHSLDNLKAAKAKALVQKKEVEAKALTQEKEAKALVQEKEAEAKAVASKKEEQIIRETPAGKYPKIDFYPAPTNMFSIIESAPENTNTEILPLRFKNAIIDGKQNIYIRAHTGDTWISYQSDEDDIKRFVLKQGRSVLIKGNKVLLFMGNVSVAKIFYNNKLIDAPTSSGVKSLIFPEELASEFELPLFPSYKGIPIKAEEYKANMAE